MREINYFKIMETPADILRNAISLKTDIGNNSLRVEVEDTAQLIPDKCPWIGIYLSSWETPWEEEKIGGSTPHTTYLEIELWLYEFALENRQGAILRDRLMQKVKEVLKNNRKINNTVLISRFEGGEFDNAYAETGFFKGVSIKLKCEVRE